VIDLLAAGAAASVGVLATAVYHPNCPLFGRVTGSGPSDERRVYLTFDDGPNPWATEAILETLERHRVPAAFFMVGEHVRRHPATARRVAAQGHDIGNHTQTHTKLHLQGLGRVRRELESAHAEIAGTTGVIPRSFRAPHGYRSPLVAPAARRLGYRVFGWSFGVWDTTRPGAPEIRRRVRAKLRPGAIVLLHDGDGYDPYGDRRQTAEALSGIIQDACDAGYELGSLRELAS
jgi:peptidoglycan/xylan/chitin deacetylase (PgdA/CDA1 family)